MITDTDCDDVAEVKSLISRMGFHIDQFGDLCIWDHDGEHTMNYSGESSEVTINKIMEDWRRNK